MKRLGVTLLLCAFLKPAVLVGTIKKRHTGPVKLIKKGKRGKPFEAITPERVNGFFKKVAIDSYNIGKKFASNQTLKVITGTLPFYLIGRRVDAAVHRQFYDIEEHKNINQPPKFLCNLVLDDRYLALPFTAIGLSGWLHDDPYVRRRGQIFTVGLGWSFATKILIKELKTDANLRPWHQNFDRHQRAHGGNPSGHMTITAYMATFWSIEKGIKATIPLAMFTAFAFSMNVACNHHYFSQAVAGTGLGVAMGIASHAVFKDLTMPKNMTVSFASDVKGNPGIRFAYDF